MLPVTDWLSLLDHQGSQLSNLPSVQFSSDRVRSDFDMDAVELFNLFEVSPGSDGVLHLLSPISSPESPSSQTSLAAGSLLDEVVESRDSAIGSPATSLSITDHTAGLQLLTPPLIPLPDTIFVQTDAAVLMELTQAYQDFHPPQPPVSLVDPPPGVSREGLFDPSTEPATTRNYPLSSTRRAGWPYRITSYRDDDHSHVDLPFLECRRFLECHPPAEWLQVMNHRDTLYAALQL